MPGSFAAWTNGVVDLRFPADAPWFLLSSVTNASITSNQSLIGLAEIAPLGGVLAFATFQRNTTHWQFDASTNSSGLRVVVTGNVTPVPSGGEWESGDGVGGAALGVASVAVTYYLNDSSGPTPSTASYDLSVTGWPWLQANDTLGVEVRSNATQAGSRWEANGSNALDQYLGAGSRPIASFGWGTLATAVYGGGQQQDSAVGAYNNLSTPGAFLVRLQFASVTGGYHELNYDPTLQLLLPKLGPPFVPVPAWILTPTSVGVIAAGSVTCLVLAYAGRARRRPPEEGL